MTNYVDIFGSNTVPPSEQAYSALSLSANTTLQWPEFYSGTGAMFTAVLEVTPTANSSFNLLFPAANQVSTQSPTRNTSRCAKPWIAC